MVYKDFDTYYKHNKEFKQYFDKATNYLKENKPEALQDFLNLITLDEVLFAMHNNISTKAFVEATLF